MEGLDFRRDLSAAWDLSGRYATDIFTEEAERIIQEHNSSSPLFLYLSHLASHAGNAGKLVEAPQHTINRFHHITEPNRKTYAGKSVSLWGVELTRQSFCVFAVLLQCQECHEE
jgi:arylsulfatase B